MEDSRSKLQWRPATAELGMTSLVIRVYRAVNYSIKATAACKVVAINSQTWTANAKKELYKEIKVHSQLKHPHVLDFIASETHEDDAETSAKNFYPGVYMLLELAAGGDLFDKIGKQSRTCASLRADKLVQCPTPVSPRGWRIFTLPNSCPEWSLFIPRAFVIATSSRKTSC